MAKAFNSASIKSTLGWSNAFNPDGAFPLDVSAWFGSLADAQAAAATAVEFGSTESKYHFGKQLYVFDGTECKTYLIQGDKTLKEIGSNDTPMLFVEDEAGMLALKDIKGGQQVYRTDTHTTWIFKGGEASILSNWVENAAQNDTKWEGTSDKVLFFSITQDAYDKIETKSESTLYFTVDTKRIYKGSSDVTSSVYAGDTIPAVSAAVKGKLYIDTTTFECKLTVDGTNWIVTSPGYLTDGAEWAGADSGKLATIGLIKKGLKETVDAKFAGVVSNPTYDATNLTLTLPVAGGDAVVVNIPKDKFVTAGKYYEDYPTENPTHHKVIVLTIENQEEPVIIPAESLVNVYAADNTGKNVAITVTADGKISASAVIDPTDGNALVTSEKGLKVDISGKIDKIGSATGGKIVVSDTAGNVAESAYIVSDKDTMGTDASTLPTEALVAAAITAAVNAATADKVDKVVGVENNLVIFGAGGALKDSGKKFGGATLADVPDSNTLATEAAVKAAVEASQLVWGSVTA